MQMVHRITFKFTLMGIVISMSLNCGSSNRLHEYEFRQQTAAAILATPPAPEVFTDTDLWIEKNDPIGSLLRIGTTVVKEVELAKVAGKLDSAMQNVDVPEQIKEHTLEHCTELLRIRPSRNIDNSDFLFDFHILNYGIEAKSWNAAIYFKIEVDIMLLDNRTDLLIWKKRIKEKNRISSQLFGAGDAIGNVITAMTLAKLSTQQIENGFRNLADFTSDRMARKLYQDYIKSRETD